MSKFEALCLTNVSEPMQYAAMKALEADITENTNTVRRRLEVLVQKAKEMNLEFVKPDGAMYLFAKVNQEGFDGVKFANELLDLGLAVAPGEGFGDYINFIRISACREENVLTDGMNILTGKTIGPVCIGEEKKVFMEQIAEKYDIDLQTSFAYSDHHADVPFLKAVGHPVAVCPTRRLRSTCMKNNWDILYGKS